MKIVSPIRYWTIDELKELKAALDASQYGLKSVLYRGRWVQFRGHPTFTFHEKDIVTVEGLEMRIVEPPR